MRAKFSEISYEAGAQKSCCASKASGEENVWMTAERIPVKGAYSATVAKCLPTQRALALCITFLTATSLIREISESAVAEA